MDLFVTILIVFCTVSFSPSEARGGRGGGGRSSSGGGWRSSGSSSGSSGSSGSSWGSSSGSPGSSWGSSSGSSGSHSDSPSPRRDNPFGSSQSSGRDSPSPNRADPFDSPSSSMHRPLKPGRQTNPSDDPVSVDHDGQSSGVSSARLWRRRSWVRSSRSHSDSQGNSEDAPEDSSFGTNTAYEAERSAPTIYDMLPSCENLGEAMWTKYDELMQNGEMSSNSCQEDDPDVCTRQDIEKVRCAVTEGIPQECMDEIMAFMRGGDVCNEADKENLS
ncbi:hypothetical protein AVEN_118664-1 [Araneus ventricosus]|uniref:Uncharacterized protein n=1 Tax=Araneus ventricosus TaxID=182803 RepID=A0A4Y2AW42_ARAVE|nr:hypothetical protein AVEN_118664-1 [Araneus ventricosus]